MRYLIAVLMLVFALSARSQTPVYGVLPYSANVLGTSQGQAQAATAAQVASGTTTNALTNSGAPVIGYNEGVGEVIGEVADASLFTSILTAASDGGVAAWSQCQFGI